MSKRVLQFSRRVLRSTCCPEAVHRRFDTVLFRACDHPLCAEKYSDLSPRHSTLEIMIRNVSLCNTLQEIMDALPLAHSK